MILKKKQWGVRKPKNTGGGYAIEKTGGGGGKKTKHTGGGIPWKKRGGRQQK